MAEECKLSILGPNGSITECNFSNEGFSSKLEGINETYLTGVDFVILDKEVLPILHLVTNSNDSQLKAMTRDSITNTQQGFLVIETPVGEIPVGSFSSDYNPSVDTIVVAFSRHETDGAMNIYSGALVLGEIVKVDARGGNQIA